MTSLMNRATEFVVQRLIPLVEIRNFNEHYYLKIQENWVYFNPLNKTKYEDAYEKISYHLTGFFKKILNDLNHLNQEEENVYSEIKEVIEKYFSVSEKYNGNYTINNFDVYERKYYNPEMLTQFIDKILKKLFKYVKMNIPNTAFDDENLILPLELTNLIYSFIPNDTNMDFVNNIKKNIMLPKNEVIAELIKFIPHIESSPKIIEIYHKYLDLYITSNLIINILRDKFRNEFHDKKSFPDLLPIVKSDIKIIKKYIYLNNSIDELTTFINYSIEQLLYSEIKEIREIKVFENYENFKIKFNNREPLHNISEIEIISKIFNYGYDYKFYKKNYKLPELLSNKTNILTTFDIHIIKQFPVWVKSLLQNISNRTIDKMDYFSKLGKYYRKQTMIQRVETLLKIQNEYGYHNLQKYKNQCRHELKKIEKFIDN